MVLHYLVKRKWKLESKKFINCAFLIENHAKAWKLWKLLVFILWSMWALKIIGPWCKDSVTRWINWLPFLYRSVAYIDEKTFFNHQILSNIILKFVLWLIKVASVFQTYSHGILKCLQNLIAERWAWNPIF